MRITSVEAIPIRMPMRSFTDAYSNYVNNDFVLVKVEADGLVGWGEAPCSVTVGFYGETLETVLVSIHKNLAPKLVGHDPTNIRGLHSIMDIAQGSSVIAKTGLDLALYDLAGKCLGAPVSTILGGRQREFIPACSEIGIADHDTMVSESLRLIDLGFEVIKIKAGRDMEDEMKGLRMIRDAVGKSIELRVDPNAGWSREDTIRAAKVMRDCDVRYLEQPLPGWDLQGLSYLRKATEMSMMVDESVWTPQDVARVASAEAADIVNIKITKTAGLRKALDVYATAAAFGLPCMIGTELEANMGIAAKLQIASSLESLPYACEYTELAFQSISLMEKPKLEHGAIRVPSGQGLGASPDIGTLKQYTVAPDLLAL